MDAGRIEVFQPGVDVPAGWVRSYDDRGRCWAFPAEDRQRTAIDVERLDRPVDIDLVERWGATSTEQFIRRWTVAETLAKLDDVPIVLWLADHGLPPLPEDSSSPPHRSDVHIVHFSIPDEGVVVTVGHCTGV
jgi:hypothetical protein